MNKAETAAARFEPAKNGWMRNVEVDEESELAYLTVEVSFVSN
jgi:hypothetical protein